MSRTLPIGNEGPRAIFFRPWPNLFPPQSPLTARVGSTPVRQFNIRPSRKMRQCISLLRPAPPVRLSCDVRGGDDLARGDIEADEDGSIQHESPFHECGAAATVLLNTAHCRPNPRIRMQQGALNFYVLLISSCSGSCSMAGRLYRLGGIGLIL